ncbi:DDE-type integrase/transposase/recombinase [Francisellaceae bacterium]|nr:DDE-type integrase/transposase/recombinase [Francisellaceae bacterium]
MLNETALFRLSVLGPLTSKINLNQGELKKVITELAHQHFDIPNSKRTQISTRTIERWYYAWKRNGIEGLAPKYRSDKGVSKITPELSEKIIRLKEENMGRSLSTIMEILKLQGNESLPKSSIHRLLKSYKLSHRVISDSPNIERRQFEAYRANDIWYSDVMHGPHIYHQGKQIKTYLISYMDDASRLMTHSQFHIDEQSHSVEAVLKEAIMRRGLPKRLIIDNGSAYRSRSMLYICAKLGIHPIFCRPYEPEGKGKIERWHRTVRDQFLNELQAKNINSLSDLNDRLHAWIEEIYHTREHTSLGKSPLTRFREDIQHTSRLGDLLEQLDDIFLHRVERTVTKTGTVKYEGKHYEVAYQYAKQRVSLVFDPVNKAPKYIEDLVGNHLCDVFKVNKLDNLSTPRQRPDAIDKPNPETSSLAEDALHKHENKYKTLGVDE